MNFQNSRIDLLPSLVSDKIAAGEVVERPASVVKELVENSLDAGATEINITVEDAGFSLIRIADNGFGIHPDDLVKCTLRHATSKIRTVDDLFNLGTLGFRGEALASIASVSKLSIETCRDNTAEGFGMNFSDGESSSVYPVSRGRGTTISVKDLFYNTPARKKFTGKPRAERMALLRYIEQLVIPFPSVHFTVIVDGKKIIEAPQTNTPRMRIAQIIGTQFAKDLIKCTAESDGMTAVTYISKPSDASPRPRFQYLYVNLRRIDNDSVTFGIREGFSRFIMSKHRPAWFCFLEIDPSKIDVNIHPTKQKVKFENDKEMFRFMYKMVKSGIESQMATAEDAVNTTASKYSQNTTTENSEWSFVGEDMLPIVPGNKSASVKNNDAIQTSLSFLSVQNDKKSDIDSESKILEMPSAKQSNKNIDSWDLIPCYQIHNMYILAQLKSGILLIDQHAAHERVLYEQAIADLEDGRSESQRILFPIVIEFSQSEKMVVLSGRDYFNSLGFEIQDFGGNSISVSSIPAVGLSEKVSVEIAIREMVENLLEEKDSEILSSPQKRYAAAFACAAAIKAGQKMEQEEMHSLLNALFAAKNPFICPHGRPTSIQISLSELSRRFLRS